MPKSLLEAQQGGREKQQIQTIRHLLGDRGPTSVREAALSFRQHSKINSAIGKDEWEGNSIHIYNISMAIFSEQWSLLMLQVLAHCACYLLNSHDTIPAAVFSNWKREVSKNNERLYLVHAETVGNLTHFGA